MVWNGNDYICNSNIYLDSIIPLSNLNLCLFGTARHGKGAVDWGRVQPHACRQGLPQFPEPP